ncbi:hypothetical protein [Paenibacillus cymbidii]|uniref:hypothetical protein n=1 Tax=Paenibacillus cymbidii TaxID=1639034 RepID=UPI0010802BE3|nr:hypothetical protein [Paenibacillus cymbidii]
MHRLWEHRLFGSRLPRQTKTLIYKGFLHSLQKRGVKETIEEIENTYNSVLNRITTFEKEQVEVDILSDSFFESNFSLLKQDKYKKLESKYFTAFFREFNSNSRPVVGIYHPDTNQMQILCVNHINKTKRDSRFLDLKQFSHNSPYIVEILVGISIALPLMKEIKFHLDEYKLKKLSTRIDEETATLNQRLEEIYKKLETISTDKGLTSIENVKDEYLKSHIEETKNNNDKKINEPIIKYDFLLTNIIIKE